MLVFMCVGRGNFRNYQTDLKNNVSSLMMSVPVPTWAINMAIMYSDGTIQGRCRSKSKEDSKSDSKSDFKSLLLYSRPLKFRFLYRNNLQEVNAVSF